jgi:hypothetical protein
LQTCITSPPYWGLREYGTALWLGGDPRCGHVRSRSRRREIETRTGRSVTVGALYRTLDRMEEKGYVTSWFSDPVPLDYGLYADHRVTGRDFLNGMFC